MLESLKILWMLISLFIVSLIINWPPYVPLSVIFNVVYYKYLDELLALLKPFPIRTVYADENYAYQKRLSPGMLVSGKKNTQRIERDHLTLRTRIKRLCRKTICFSKNKEIHIAVVGTFINIFFFGREFDVSTLL